MLSRDYEGCENPRPGGGEKEGKGKWKGGGKKQRERGVGEGRIVCVNGGSRYTGRGADKFPYCTNFMYQETVLQVVLTAFPSAVQNMRCNVIMGKQKKKKKKKRGKRK